MARLEMAMMSGMFGVATKMREGGELFAILRLHPVCSLPASVIVSSQKSRKGLPVLLVTLRTPQSSPRP